MKTIDMTPTWAAIMPALIAALQHGTGAGQAMATEELARLARLVDSNNEAARAAPSEEEAARHKAADLQNASRHARGTAAFDLAGFARDFMAEGAFIRAACYWEAAARIAPAGMDEARDFRVSADLAEREAAALLSKSHELNRKEERNDIAQALQNWANDSREAGRCYEAAALFNAALEIAPYSLNADLWRGEAKQSKAAAQSGRAASIKTAFAEGRREALEELRHARGAIAAALASLKAPHYGNLSDAADHAGEALNALEAYQPRPVAAPGPDALAEALDMARSCLAAYPSPALNSATGREALRNTARDLRDSLAALIGALS